MFSNFFYPGEKGGLKTYGTGEWREWGRKQPSKNPRTPSAVHPRRPQALRVEI